MAREANDGVSAHTQEVCFFGNYGQRSMRLARWKEYGSIPSKPYRKEILIVDEACGTRNILGLQWSMDAKEAS